MFGVRNVATVAPRIPRYSTWHASVTDDLQNVYDAHLVDGAHTLETQLILIVVEGERCELFRVLSDTENQT